MVAVDDSDRPYLTLTFEHWRWLEVEQQREVRRLRLPLHPPGLAPVVLATDTDGERRAYRAVDFQCLVLVARAIAQAAATGRDGEQTVSLCGVTHAVEVSLRHPEASEADVSLSLKYCDEDRVGGSHRRSELSEHAPTDALSTLARQHNSGWGATE